MAEYPISHKARFLNYRDDSVILKCRRYAHWTLPQLMVDLALATNGTAQVLERDYQEIGPLLVNNLSAKLTSLLFPSNRPFFKIDASKELKDHSAKMGKTTADLQAGLSRMEQDASQRLFLNASYNQLVMALKHLIVTGNVLIYRDKKLKKTTAYGLQSYSCRRDGRGNLLDVVVREYTSFEGLSTAMQRAITAKNPTRYQGDCYNMTVQVYTRIEREETAGGKIVWIETQEIEDVPVGTPGKYPEHLCPWTVPTWNLVTGEHYGRGLVEDFAGGFAKLSDASEALALYGISAMKFVNLVQPGQGADIDELANAETGEYVQGSKDMVQVFEAGDANKITAMRSEIQDVFGNLSRAFMYKGETRQAERVTAYELKQDAMEANTILGGTYSSLAESMQVPLAHTLLTETEPGTLKGIISGDLKLNIMAGIPALGRAADVQNIIAAAQDAAAVVPVLIQMDKRIDPLKLLDMIYSGQSVDTTQFFLTDQEIAAKDAAAQQAQAGQQQINNSTTMADQADQLRQLGS